MTCRALFISASLLYGSVAAAGAACTERESGSLRMTAVAALVAAPSLPLAPDDGAASDARPVSAPLMNAPSGSCLLPSGQWCWPISPTSYGQPCTCPNGQVGIGR